MKTNNENSHIHSVIIAVTIVGLLMLISGYVYRVLAARLESPVGTIVITQDEFNKLPLQIDDWTGQDVALDEAIVRATDTDAHINRRYLRQNSQDNIGLYIAYGVRARDLMPHRPEVCYTGAGWTLVEHHSIDFTLSGDTELPCRILQFKRGTLNTEKTIVLDYYIVDGQYCEDISLLRSKAWRGSSAIDYAAQVQIVAPINANQDPDSAISNISDFATESAPLIIELFENNQQKRSDEITPEREVNG